MAKKMARRCIVPNCPSKTEKTYHIFPANEKIGRIWINAIKNPALDHLSYAEIRKKKLIICRQHFEDNAYMGGILKANIKRDAVPTLKLANLNNNEKEVSMNGNQDVNESQKCVDISRMNLVKEMESNKFPGLTFSAKENNSSAKEVELFFLESPVILNVDQDNSADEKLPLKETMNFDRNNQIVTTSAKSASSKLKFIKLSLDKVKLTPVAKKIQCISITAGRQIFNTTFSFKGYNAKKKNFEEQTIVLNQTFVSDCYNHKAEQLFPTFEVLAQN